MKLWRSLFTKILLWFLVTMTVTFLGAVLIAGHNAPDRPVMFGRMANQEFRGAREAYETGGKPKLSQYLKLATEGSGVKIVLADARGRDLLTGEDNSRFLQNQNHHGPPRGPEFLRLFRRPPPAFAKPSPDGQYWWIIRPLRTGSDNWLISPPQLWMIFVIGTLCWLFAYYLTSPVRELQKTVEQFGHGDFSARSGSPRGDEFGQLSRTFDEMAARIETLVAAQSRLLLDVSHELRSPLTRLGVAVEIARGQEDKEAALNRIQREADRLNVLVDQLLQVTRAESDRSRMDVEPVRVDDLLREIVADCQIEAGARGTSIQLDAVPATVEGDAELLRRAAENVLRNAIRYSPPDKPVEIHEFVESGAVVLRIRDHGPGVPSAELVRLFDYFYRVESDRNRLSGGGVGLGLSIARRAVELHRGTITASNASPGLLMELRVPVSLASESRSAA